MTPRYRPVCVTVTVLAGRVLVFSPTVNEALVARWSSNPVSSVEPSTQVSVTFAFLPERTAVPARPEGASGGLTTVTAFESAEADEPPPFTALTRYW
ncbi:hypothetical protein PSR1_03512 [Anaeromyxobacter sp. PSR-1]|nr:hypothetical protein PSR1_03512 [Anaeromyxobacter sp. PSR-1]